MEQNKGDEEDIRSGTIHEETTCQIDMTPRTNPSTSSRRKRRKGAEGTEKRQVHTQVRVREGILKEREREREHHATNPPRMKKMSRTRFTLGNACRE